MVSVFFLRGNIYNSFISFIYLFINLLLFSVVLMCVSKGNKPFLAASVGSLIFCLISVSYGVYEINTGKHLAIGNFDSDALELRDYSSFTFGNYNNFIMLLLLVLPFIVSLICHVNFKLRFLGFLSFLGIIYIILTNGSRSGMIGIVLSLVYLFFITKGVLGRVVLLLVTLFASLNIENDFQFLFMRLANQGFEDDSRRQVLYDVFPLFLDHLMLGFGVGNFSYYVSSVLNLDVYAPHNLFFEILYDLGLFVFILFIWFLIKIFLNSFFRNNKEKIFIYFSLFLIIPFSVVNSGYLLGVYMWLYISLLLGLSARRDFFVC